MEIPVNGNEQEITELLAQTGAVEIKVSEKQ
jgi:hypothetical protein